MSSKKAIYESSILGVFEADGKFVDSGFMMIGAAGLVATAAAVETVDLGFDFGTAVSLRTRTEAGT